MPCPLCGDVCHCMSDPRTPSRLRSRFRPEEGANDSAALNRSSVLIDPEADDGSELKFAASLDEVSTPPRFVVEQERTLQSARVMGNDSGSLIDSGNDACMTGTAAESAESSPDFHPGLLQTDFIDNAGASVWKQEVAARLNSYRARRKFRPPKYPSLRLKFEPAEVARSNRAMEPITAAPQAPQPEPERSDAPAMASQEPGMLSVAPEPVPSAIPERARIIEFPRPYLPPVPPPDELAEAVAERPRILEVPDVEPPPPALGGILLETEEIEPERRRPGFDIPLKGASMPRRLCAAGVDGLLVLSACGIFGYIAYRLSPFIPPLPQLAIFAVLVPGIFWSGYQYLLLVYTGSTPGLRAAQLRLCDFDGSAVPRSRRRWRVFASILSGLSLALGFAWCFLDEDALCWHDRITHTYLAPSK
jgi:uncharacterized RDD family membrane protein YckC